MKPKTPSYTLKAVADHHKRKKDAGMIRYSRYIKKEWKPILDKVLDELKLS
jgi:hypothetical protein